MVQIVESMEIPPASAMSGDEKYNSTQGDVVHDSLADELREMDSAQKGDEEENKEPNDETIPFNIQDYLNRHDVSALNLNG